MGDGKFKSIEPNEEILEIGKDENEETPEQLELERKKVEQEQNFEVGFREQTVRLGYFETFHIEIRGTTRSEIFKFGSVLVRSGWIFSNFLGPGAIDFSPWISD